MFFPNFKNVFIARPWDIFNYYNFRFLLRTTWLKFVLILSPITKTSFVRSSTERWEHVFAPTSNVLRRKKYDFENAFLATQKTLYQASTKILGYMNVRKNIIGRFRQNFQGHMFSKKSLWNFGCVTLCYWVIMW